jgi:glycosyltransferase involved in cell wall biosynthesis
VRLLLVVDVFTPVRTSAAVQMRDLARTLLRSGHRCTVVTPDDLLLQPWSLAVEDSIPVLRIRCRPLKRINLVQRALNELALSRWMWSGYRYSPLAAEQWDAVVFYSPTIFFGRFVARLKALHSCRAFLILRDVFPDWAADAGVMRRGPHYWLFKAYARYQYSVADFIGIESPSNRRYFPGGDARVQVLPNWIDLSSPAPAPTPLPAQLADSTVMVYAGNIGVAQDMDNLLRLAASLRDRMDCKLLFVGDGTERARVQLQCARQGLDNVLFLPEVDPQQLRGVLRACDIGLISLDRRLRSHNIPGKLLSYLEAGLPVLASINPGNDLGQLIENGRAGRVVWNGEDQRFHQAAIQMIADKEGRSRMAEAARDLCRSAFSSNAVARQIVETVQAPTQRGG